MNLKLEAHFVSMIRIAVAAAFGAAARIAFDKWGVDIDGETLTSVFTALAIGIYYGAAKLIERRWPKAHLLGLADPDIRGGATPGANAGA